MFTIFEITLGVTRSLVGMTQVKLSQEILDAHEEQQARRSLKKLHNGRSPCTMDTSKFLVGIRSIT